MSSFNFEFGLEHVEDLRDKSLEIELFVRGDNEVGLQVTRCQIMGQVSILTELMSSDALFWTKQQKNCRPVLIFSLRCCSGLCSSGIQHRFVGSSIPDVSKGTMPSKRQEAAILWRSVMSCKIGVLIAAAVVEVTSQICRYFSGS